MTTATMKKTGRKAKQARGTASRKHHHPMAARTRAKGGRGTFREEYKLTRKTLSKMTGLAERTLASWEEGKTINDAGRRALTLTQRLLGQLAEVMKKDFIPEWLEKPNDAFAGLKPLEVLDRGEVDRLWRLIYFLGSGSPA